MLHRVLLGLVAVCLGIARSSEVVSLLEHDFNLETSMNSPKANLKLFEDIDIDKIQAFFSTFNQVQLLFREFNDGNKNLKFFFII